MGSEVMIDAHSIIFDSEGNTFFSLATKSTAPLVGMERAQPFSPGVSLVSCASHGSRALPLLK